MEDWLQVRDLMELAERDGHSVSARSLELWRYRGLLPRGQRAPTGRAAWRYPPSSGPQLLRLLHWRERTRSLELIRIALWLDGFAIELDGVRDSLLALLEHWTRAIERELGDGDITERIELLARKAAGKRGRAALPRKVRMSADERTRACAYALACMLGAEEEIERRRKDAVLLERMLGLRSGRGAAIASFMPLEERTLRMARPPSPEHLRRVLTDAPPEELELVRAALNLATTWAPLLLPALLEQFGARAVALVDVSVELLGNPPPEYKAFAVITLLVSLHARGHAVAELSAQLQQITAAEVDRELFELLPESRRIHRTAT
ncbi:MAG: hypothetical protein ACLQBB_15310 [Solirubrobacteraceae bacterium]